MNFALRYSLSLMNAPKKIDESLKFNKGRGALSNSTNRFESLVSETDAQFIHDEQNCKPPTQLIEDHSRTIVSFNDSPDIPFEQSINPYRGCEHGCVYCYARPTHAYLGLSPGLDFETKILVKSNASALLKRYLAGRKYQCKPLAFGTNTDAYQPVEKKLRIMRQLLELLNKQRHPVTIVTKSSLVCRDIDLLSQMAKDNLCRVVISVTTLNAQLCRTLEPRAAAPHSRIKTIKTLTQAGIPVMVLVAPVIPFLNDSEIESILNKVSQAGALQAGYVLLRLPHETKDLFKQWLAVHNPMKADHIMSLIKQSRGGKDYDSRYGHRMRGSGQYAQLIAERFKLAKSKFGLNQALDPLVTDLFVKPSKIDQAQMDLWQ